MVDVWGREGKGAVCGECGVWCVCVGGGDGGGGEGGRILIILRKFLILSL